MTLPPPQVALWQTRPSCLAQKEYARFDAVLQITAADNITQAPYANLLTTTAKKIGHHHTTKSPPPPTLITTENGTSIIQLQWQNKKSTFDKLETLRKHLLPLANAKNIAIDIRIADAVAHAVYAALIITAKLNGDARSPYRLFFAGCDKKTATPASINAYANIQSRALFRYPPNELTVATFARYALTQAKQNNLGAKVYDHAMLKKMGAGAIIAVGRASKSPPRIIRLRYKGGGKKPFIALIGKGVCYDTGGVNVKSARYMRGMKGDMAGAANMLAAIIAAARYRLPLNIDAYLSLADNAIGATAYQPDEVIQSLSGKRIEIVHSDAEGRMILADTLTLATEEKRDLSLIITHATLTGTMRVALGDKISGVFATDEKQRKLAMKAADLSGERLCYFPMPEDYQQALKSDVADIKQCAEEGEADHILAALFLKQFIQKPYPWLHVDLSAASCKNGLAAATGPETGFGANWTIELLKLLSAK